MIEKQKRLVVMINALEDAEEARKIKAAWASHPRLETFSACCVSMSKSNASSSSSSSSSSAANKGVRNGDASAKATIDLKSIAKNAALKKEKLFKLRQNAAEAYRNNEWLGDVWPVWSQHNRMHCQTGLSALLNDLQDDASSSDNDDDHNMRGGGGGGGNSSGTRHWKRSYSGRTSSSDDSSDSSDDDNGQYTETNFIRYEAEQHSACEACALSCSDFRELCVSNYPSAPPPEIADYMFSHLLPACHTQSQR